MSYETMWSRFRLLLMFFCLAGLPSAIYGQVKWQEDEIIDLIPGQLPVTSQNWEICQDPVTKYIYLANSAGLIEYNGISARTFTMPFRKGVRSVYINNDGMVFSGSYEDFGIWQRDSIGELTYSSLVQGIEISKNDEIWNIIELNHTVYFQSFTTVYAYNYNTVTRIGCPSNMLFFFRAGDGFMGQSLDQGLYWFDGSEFNFIKGSEIFGNLKIHAIIEFDIDEYWICTANDGIFMYDGTNFTPQKSDVSDFLKAETCNAGLAINDSIVCFGTILKGIVFCNKAGEILRSYDYSNGLNNNTVLSLFRDPEQRVWIGLDDGANFVNMSSPVTIYENRSGNLGTIYTIIRNKNCLYLGTNHGLFAADINDANGYYSFKNLRIIPNTQGQVWMLDQFDGQIICGHNEGTFNIEDNFSAEKISDVTGGWSMKPYGDLLLQGTYTGIVAFKKDANGKWKYNNRISGYYEPTRFLEVDYLGFVWAVHPQKGIYRLELNDRADSVTNAIFFSSVADSTRRLSISRINNQVVFLTADHIYSFDYEGKKFQPIISLESGLGKFAGATQITYYRKNSYWFILKDRIALFNITRDFQAEKVMEFYHEYSELPWREQPFIALDSGTLFIPTRQAFSTYSISRLNNPGGSDSVVLSRIIFSGGGDAKIILPDLREPSTIPRRLNNLTVYFAYPSGYDRGGREFLYRLEELGEPWYSTATDNFTFPNLKSGKYHLQVKEALSEKATEAVFIINKPLFLSRWAVLIYVLLVSAITFGVVRIWRKALDRHRKMIEYEVGKNRLESELDYKSYELMLTMRYLIRKTDTLRELREKLESAKENSAKLPAHFVREMQHIIDHGLDTQTEEWQNVMKNLKLSQEGFFSKLKRKYPALTPNDLRLCSYLRMNFTTKEIANLTNISSRAVEIARYRLRTKLNLSHDVNLTEFLIHQAESEES